MDELTLFLAFLDGTPAWVHRVGMTLTAIVLVCTFVVKVEPKAKELAESTETDIDDKAVAVIGIAARWFLLLFGWLSKGPHLKVGRREGDDA